MLDYFSLGSFYLFPEMLVAFDGFEDSLDLLVGQSFVFGYDFVFFHCLYFVADLVFVDGEGDLEFSFFWLIGLDVEDEFAFIIPFL